MVKKQIAFGSVEEMLEAVKKEADRLGMTLDQFVRPENITRSAVLRAAVESPVNEKIMEQLCQRAEVMK